MSAISTQSLLDEVISLPVEMRAKFAEALLESLNPASDDIEQAWREEAEKRLESIRNGTAKTIDGEEVFQKIANRFSK